MSSSKGIAFAASSSSAGASSSGGEANDKNGQNSAGGADGSRHDPLPQLPAVDPNSTEKLPTLKFGETLRLDAMGPIILNKDGTTRRIDNWNELSKQEQEVTWRRIKKRNEERRNKLLEERGEDVAEEDEL